MAQTINTNVISLNAQRNLNTSQGSLATSMQRLSSGLRVNSAKDDAAGLAIAERMNTQVRGLNVAARNANDGISLAQTAEGALGKMGDMLQRVRELAVQSANATNSDSDRAALNAEVVQLKSEIGRIAQQTQFNGLNLLDGSFTAQQFQIGANQGQIITIDSIVNANIDALGNWTSLPTPAGPIAGAAPTGAGYVAPALADPTVSAASGVFTSAVSDTDGQNFTFTVGGVEILNVTQAGGNAETIAAADIDVALGAATAALTAAGISFTGTAAGNDLVFTRADGTDLAIALSSDFATAGNFAGAGFVGNHTGGTPADAGTPGTFAAIIAGEFTINGTDILVNAAPDAATRLANLQTAINQQTGTTGVVATIVNNALSLTSIGGSGNVDIAGTGSVTAQTGLTPGVNAATPGAAQVGFAALEVATTAGANNALIAIDAALDDVNRARGTLGAVQSRFENAIGNIQTTAENLTAARGRIMDADFAMETANLSRAQILQQAGTAMVAQANQLPQQVLSLLK